MAKSWQGRGWDITRWNNSTKTFLASLIVIFYYVDIWDWFDVSEVQIFFWIIEFSIRYQLQAFQFFTIKNCNPISIHNTLTSRCKLVASGFDHQGSYQNQIGYRSQRDKIDFPKLSRAWMHFAPFLWAVILEGSDFDLVSHSHQERKR